MLIVKYITATLYNRKNIRYVNQNVIYFFELSAYQQNKNKVILFTDVIHYKQGC